VLRDYGNMSSVTVLFVIARYLERYGPVGSGYGVISALGPGFCSESLLVDLAMRHNINAGHFGNTGQKNVQSSLKQGGVPLL